MKYGLFTSKVGPVYQVPNSNNNKLGGQTMNQKEKELSQTTAQAKELMDSVDFGNTTALAQLQKIKLDLERISETIRIRLPHMIEGNNTGLLTGTSLKLDVIGQLVQKEISKLVKDESRFEMKRDIPVTCDICGCTNYLTRQEFLMSKFKNCTKCGTIIGGKSI